MLKPTKLALLLVALYSAPSLTYAIETHKLYHPNGGQQVFEVRFFNPEDGPYFEDDEQDGPPSPVALSQEAKNKILQGLQYWADIIHPAQGAQPAVLNIGTNPQPNNAAALPARVEEEDYPLYGNVGVLAALLGEPKTSLPSTKGAQASIFYGDANWDDDVAYMPSQYPVIGSWDIFSTAVHEMAHALGVLTTISDEERSGGKHRLQIGIEDEDSQSPVKPWAFDRYTQLLHDDNGRAAQAGQVIICPWCEYTDDEIAAGFDIRKDQGYLKGDHIDDALQGAMPGIPVRMGFYGPSPGDSVYDDNTLSHLELRNSLMSHQTYSNFAVFMEAELAILQDLGYKIDRRNFFGSSVYGSGLTLHNTNPYFARNTAGTDYLDGQYSQTTLGLGLHVYGSQNDITQSADILTQGAGAAGMRVDGEENTIHIPEATKIHANGLNGRGTMFTYGKDHQLIHQGEIQAMGDNGVGLLFSFGNNSNSNASEYRGSWIRNRINPWTGQKENLNMLPELQGALMKQVDISGKVVGKNASIYIGSNALVDKINILAGAQLQGDIFADYHEYDPQGQLRTGMITFGLQANNRGQATSQADPNFVFRYDGNIMGPNNLRLSTEGGVTSLNGQHQIVSVNVAKGSTLQGNGRYTLTSAHQGRFINQGRVSPGNSFGEIVIKGDFTQTSTGELLMEVDGQGNHDILRVIGDANVDGEFIVKPQASWYDSDWRLEMDDMFQVGGNYQGKFEVPLEDFSPSVDLAISHDGIFSMTRAADAYSQYAGDSNSRAVGQALDEIVGKAPKAMQPLFIGLDFSALDGSTIKRSLPQLSASSYSMMSSESVRQEQRYSDILQSRHFAPYYAETPAGQGGDYRLFILPMASEGTYKAKRAQLAHDASSYGLMLGAERQLSQSAWTVGAHFAYSDLRTKSKELSAKGDSSLYSLGLHARYIPGDQGFWASGVARLSYVRDKMKRQIDFGSYSASHRSDWSGWNATVGAKGGYRFALSESAGLSPVVSLDYTHLKRASHTENGALTSDLHLNALRLNSLRAGVGVELDWATELHNESQLKGTLAVNWYHELLNNKVKQGAHFVSAPSVSFNNQHALLSRNALNLQAGLSYQASKNLELGAHVAHDWYQGGGRNISGHLKASWRF